MNEYDRIYARDELVYSTTKDILAALESLGVSKVELARRIGKPLSFVTQRLGGYMPMTLPALSDICFALKLDLKITIAAKVE